MGRTAQRVVDHVMMRAYPSLRSARSAFSLERSRGRQRVGSWGTDGQMWRAEDTHLRSSFAFCTAANAAALTLDASKPDGSAHTRHIGQFAGWSRYEAGT